MNQDAEKTPALYVHIPFCKSKCGYCDFFSVVSDGATIDRYLTAMQKEVLLSGNTKKISSIYIGGGNPAILSINQLNTLLSFIKHFQYDKNCEFTIEANPETVTVDFIETILKAGVNRISLGAQSFQESILKTLERNCSPETVFKAVEIIKQYPGLNLNLDLIWAVPGQTLTRLESDIRQMIALNIGHISAYSLMIEDGTSIAKKVKTKKLYPTGDDEFLDMYALLHQLMNEAGYRCYEVSNFALPGKECRHNENYWELGEYIALGAGASGFLNNIRYSNIEDVETYIDKLSESILPRDFEEYITPELRWMEYIMLSLRTEKGLDLQRLKSYSVTPELITKTQKTAENLDILKKHKLLTGKNDIFRCTLDGYKILDTIIVDLI